VARVRLIHDLHHAMAIDEATMPLVLSLLDQVYALRGTLRDLLGALGAQSEDVRAAVSAAVRRGPQIQ
jgi:chaperone modulatory protein CbpM